MRNKTGKSDDELLDVNIVFYTFGEYNSIHKTGTKINAHKGRKRL